MCRKGSSFLLLLLCGAALGVSLSGCVGPPPAGAIAAPIGGARTLPKGEFAGGGGFAVGALPTDDYYPSERSTVRFHGEARVSLGSDVVDLGGQVWLGEANGGQLQPRIALHRSETASSGVDLAVAPAGGFHVGQKQFTPDIVGRAFIPHATLPLLLGMNTPKADWQIGVFSRNQWIPNEEANSTFASLAGGMIGVVIPFGESIRAEPRITAEYPVENYPDEYRFRTTNPSVLVSLGFWAK